MDLPLHAESRLPVGASPKVLFDFLDDPRQLGTHMSRSSWMMAGARMDYTFDAYQGKAVGSEIRMSGRVLGIRLAVNEVVIERVTPDRKVWQTIGMPRLLVIGPYRMGFEIAARGSASELTVFIDYALPATGAANWLGRALGGTYALWCVRRMAQDSEKHFRHSPESRRPVDGST